MRLFLLVFLSFQLSISAPLVDDLFLYTFDITCGILGKTWNYEIAFREWDHQVFNWDDYASGDYIKGSASTRSKHFVVNATLRGDPGSYYEMYFDIWHTCTIDGKQVHLTVLFEPDPIGKVWYQVFFDLDITMRWGDERGLLHPTVFYERWM